MSSYIANRLAVEEVSRQLFTHENDSAETLKLDHSAASASASAAAAAEAAAAAAPTNEDVLSKCINGLNIYDLIHSNNTSSSEEKDSTDDEMLNAKQNPTSCHPVSMLTERPPITPIRKLKSSLKLSSNASSTTSLSSKNVRFAPQLTTVKRFDSSSEPISISTENSPTIIPLDSYTSEDDNEADDFWFGTSLSKMKLPLNSTSTKKRVPIFSLDYSTLSDEEVEAEEDDDDDDDDDDNDEYGERKLVNSHKHQRRNRFETARGKNYQESMASFNVIQWTLNSTNITSPPSGSNSLDLQTNLLSYLQGNNIRLHTISHKSKDQLQGLIYVTNLNFEKFIEIKFTFNNWQDIHYVTASYHRTLTSTVDEFIFTIDLTSLKFFMQMKKLLYCNPNSETAVTYCPLNMELCCRYDAKGETYYDNNNYENYQVKLTVLTRSSSDSQKKKKKKKKQQQQQRSNANANANANSNSNPLALNFDSSGPMRKSFSFDFLMSTTMNPGTALTSKSRPSIGRRFSEDRDYYNTSPLKHLYHNDTTLVKPFKVNQVTMESDPNVSTRLDQDYFASSAPNQLPPSNFETDKDGKHTDADANTVAKPDGNSHYTLASPRSTSPLMTDVQQHIDTQSEPRWFGATASADLKNTSTSVTSLPSSFSSSLPSTVPSSASSSLLPKREQQRSSSHSALSSLGLKQNPPNLDALRSKTTDCVLANSNKSAATENKENQRSFPEQNFFACSDYQTLLNSYCFYDPNKPDSASDPSHLSLPYSGPGCLSTSPPVLSQESSPSSSWVL